MAQLTSSNPFARDLDGVAAASTVGGGSIRRVASRAALYALLATLAIVILLPLWWIAASSLSTRETVWANVFPFSWRAFLPDTFSLEGYRGVFREGYGRVMINTGLVGLVTVALTILTSAPAGFAFARFQFPLKRALWVGVLASVMVPYEATVIPAYSLVEDLGWLNSWQAIVVPALANGTTMFLFRQFFADLPQDLLDAARVDGASWPRLFAQVVLPLSMPVLVTCSILVFLGQWNAFFWPMLVAPAEEFRVVQVAISVLGVQQELRFWDLLFASTTLAALVPLILVLPLQRFFISSIVGSGLKQ